MFGEVISFLVKNSDRCVQSIRESVEQINGINDFFELDNQAQWDLATDKILQAADVMQEGLSKLFEFLG